jgi:hypothetical protein
MFAYVAILLSIIEGPVSNLDPELGYADRILQHNISYPEDIRSINLSSLSYDTSKWS